MSLNRRVEKLERETGAGACAHCGLLANGLPPPPYKFGPVTFYKASDPEPPPPPPCPNCGVRPFRFGRMKFAGDKTIRETP